MMNKHAGFCKEPVRFHWRIEERKEVTEYTRIM